MGQADIWVVKVDAQNPWSVARHRQSRFSSNAAPCCGYKNGIFRILENGEAERYRPCGKCVRMEHDGPIENANDAAAAVREAAAAVGLAAMKLDDLGYPRLANAMRGNAERIYQSAAATEVES